MGVWYECGDLRVEDPAELDADAEARARSVSWMGCLAPERVEVAPDRRDPERDVGGGRGWYLRYIHMEPTVRRMRKAVPPAAIAAITTGRCELRSAVGPRERELTWLEDKAHISPYDALIDRCHGWGGAQFTACSPLGLARGQLWRDRRRI